MPVIEKAPRLIYRGSQLGGVEEVGGGGRAALQSVRSLPHPHPRPHPEPRLLHLCGCH